MEEIVVVEAPAGEAVQAAKAEVAGNMAPDYSGQLVDTSPKNYSFDPADFPLLLLLAKALQKDLFIYDLETTNLLDHPEFGIAELGMLRVRHKEQKINVNARFLHPRHTMGAKASEITGITDAMLSDKEPYGEKHALFMNQMAEQCLVIFFNGRNFDIPAIFKIHEELGLPLPQFNDILDMRDCWMKLTGSTRGRLGDVVEKYGIAVMDAHRASGDVAMTALLLNHMIWRHGVDAILECRVVDNGVEAGDDRTHAPKALSTAFVLRNRLVTYFNSGNPYEGAKALGKALGLNDEEVREADYELSNLIRDKKVPVEIFKKPELQEFILLHLDDACAKEGLTKDDPSLRMKPILEFIKKKKGCPKGMDYIQLRAALASLPAETA